MCVCVCLCVSPALLNSYQTLWIFYFQANIITLAWRLQWGKENESSWDFFFFFPPKVQKQAHEHPVLQLNFTASLWCHWWELPVFTRTPPERRLVSPGRLGLYWQSQVLSGGIKISIYQESTEAVWGAAGEMAHSGRLPAVGLWRRVQQAGMCPCRLFLDSMCDVRIKPSHPPAAFHFVKSAVQASALSWMRIIL